MQNQQVPGSIMQRKPIHQKKIPTNVIKHTETNRQTAMPNPKSTAKESVRSWSTDHTRLACGNHVLDVDEGVLATMRLKDLEGLIDELTQVLSLALCIVDGLANVQIVVLEDVEYRQNLSVIRDQRLANHLRR